MFVGFWLTLIIFSMWYKTAKQSSLLSQTVAVCVYMSISDFTKCCAQWKMSSAFITVSSLRKHVGSLFGNKSASPAGHCLGKNNVFICRAKTYARSYTYWEGCVSCIYRVKILCVFFLFFFKGVGVLGDKIISVDISGTLWIRKTICLNC